MRDPLRNATMQQLGDAQISLAFLIGFDWTIAQQWEALRQKEKQIKELKKIVTVQPPKTVLRKKPEES
jgi:hypothetical protein